MKLNFNFPLKDLTGKVVKENAGQILAHELVATPKGDAIKHYEWAVALHKGVAIEPDKSDTAYLKKFLEDNQNITILAKAPMLEIFNKSEPTEKTEKKK